METALALGTFDGVHQGHRAVLRETSGYNGVAVTFRIPPKIALSLQNALLMTPEDKFSALKECGIKTVDVLDFDRVKDIEPREFLEDLKAKYGFSKVVCGFNYRFGKGAKGDTSLIEAFCKENDIEFSCIEAVNFGGEVISSSNIRKLVEKGDVKAANQFIFGGFGFTSTVISGDRRGRMMGFPTINQEYPLSLCRVRYGVYKSEVIIEGARYKAITNIGLRPTFKTSGISCETHIFDFSKDLYGKSVTLKLVDFLRGEIKFRSIGQLKRQIEQDVLSAKLNIRI